MIDNEPKEPLEANPDQLPFVEREPERHPSPSIRLLREAVDKALMRDQKELWMLYAYDKHTQTFIAKKLKTSKSNISRRLVVIQNRIRAYCEAKQALTGEETKRD